MNSPTRPQLVGSFGMVSATHWLAAASGMGMLERGGNAFDAVVAAGLVLQVAEPHLNGPGGEVPIVLYDAAQGEVVVVDGQGPAPAEASISRFAALGVPLIPGTGLLAANVPGAFGAWMLTLQRYGRLPLREVMEPVIHYARHGVPVLPAVHRAVVSCEQRFQELWPTSAAVFLPGGRAPAAGARFANPQLALVYEGILAAAESAGAGRDQQIEGARRAFYEGAVAEAIDRFLETAELWDETGVSHPGFLRGQDLATWRASFEPPCFVDYHGVRVHKTGPWGQGPVLLQQLQLLSGFDLSSLEPDSADFVHLVIEGAKLAFADREAFYGDPRHVEVPLDELLSPGYAAERRQLVGAEASAEIRPGRPGGREPRMPSRELRDRTSALAPAAGLPPDSVGQDTCHLDVVDRFGNMVSATPSGGWLHGSPVVPGLGFPLSTRSQMFWLEEGLASSLVGGKRPRTTLTPTLVLREGKPWLACGTPGGDQQDQWSLVFFLRRLHHHLDLQSAIEVPSFHSTHFHSSFYPRAAGLRQLHLESRFSDEVVADLRGRGHDVRIHPDWSLGRICAVGTGADGQLRAGADPRLGQAYAAGR
ncbi:MAG TPA: gamma-glutamyltransferase family protein [Candidatus Dormibacteraeota bacterium]|nr:gamma-glutamyltransferase family protein [Candidatus Dormibacteraeota bacterium]